ncbi:MAG: S9 family peptidase [Flavobacteriales bacterium]|nr:S9 family peptidase [Flavobacteriales bacterium]
MQAQNKVTLEDLWIQYKYIPDGINDLKPMSDGEHFSEVKDRRLEKFSFSTGQSVGFLTPQLPFDIEEYEMNKTENTFLLTTASRPIYRYSREVKAYVLRSDNAEPQPIAKGEYVMEPSLSPDGMYATYVKDNNLYIQNLKTQKIKQITTDGKRNEIINGIPDWVYEEEFSMSRAYAWNPQSTMLAYLRFDERRVPTFSMPLYKGKLYPENYAFKYPKVGEPNSIVTLHVYDAKKGRFRKINVPQNYEYLPRIMWLEDGRLLYVTLNRLQNHMHVFVADPTTGTSEKKLEFRSARYLELEKMWNPVFVGPQELLLLSEEDGFFHIYLFNLSTGQRTQITKGPWEVTKIYGYDKDKKRIYFQAAEPSPTERHIFRVGLDGQELERLTDEPGCHEAQFAPSCRYFMRTYSALGVPPVYTCHDSNGKLLYVREANSRLRQMLDSLEGYRPELFSFTTSQNVTLHGWMIKPSGFNPKRKYPVLMYVYGGPGSQTVQNDYDGFNYLWFRMLAQMGYLVVSVDGRGTGGRGYEFRTCTYGRLGDLESTDQAEAARWLASLPYVDGSRIGIFGWSYGGYLAALCITRWAEVFKAAISVAPVTNWKFYDNIYTERYMGTLETNPTGFDDQSPIRFAKNLKGAFLLVHGSADDNVHLQNTAELVNALIASGKQFEQFIYPDRNHGIYGGLTRYHLYTLMTRFLEKSL